MQSSKNTLVIGASENPERYSYKAIRMLLKHQHSVKAIGIKPGKVEQVIIEKDKLPFDSIDTVTLYIGPKHQAEYFNYIVSLHPKRIIFNPGTENDAFYEVAKKHNIPCMEACTLVLLSTGQY